MGSHQGAGHIKGFDVILVFFSRCSPPWRSSVTWTETSRTTRRDGESLLKLRYLGDICDVDEKILQQSIRLNCKANENVELTNSNENSLQEREFKSCQFFQMLVLNFHDFRQLVVSFII